MVRHRNNGPLHDLLLRACPPNEKNEKSITILASILNIRPWAVHKWIKKGRIPAARAIEISKMQPGSGVTLEDFEAFL